MLPSTATDLAFLTRLSRSSTPRSSLQECRYRSRTEEVRGSNPLTSTPNLAGQSVASVERAALTACCGRSTAASSSRSPAQEARSDQATRPWPHMMTTERSRHLAAHLGSPTNGRSARACGLSWSATRKPSHRPTTSHNDGRVQADASPGPARPAQPRSPVPTSRSWTRRASTPTPTIRATRLPAPPTPSTTSPRSDTADAGTHGHRTPTPDTGRRTLRCPHRTLDTGRVDRQAWKTGRPHRTLDAGPLAEDVDTLTKARPASASPDHHALRPRWATQRCSCGQRLRRLATITARRWGHLPARDCLLPCRVAARSLCRLSRASVHCCPRSDSRVLRKVMRPRRMRWY